MLNQWYPQDPLELNETIDKYLSANLKITLKKINGVIVPHAGYQFSGAVAGKAFSFLKKQKNKKAIVLGLNHYLPIIGVYTHDSKFWETPLWSIKVASSNFQKTDIKGEHSIDNQIPFLQKLGFKEMLPLMVSQISLSEAEKIAEILKDEDGVLVVSTDLSHFLSYEEAVKKDKETIKAISSLDSNWLINDENCACGIFPLLVFIRLAKIKEWRPELVEYKNSGDITGEKNSVVGYAGFVF